MQQRGERPRRRRRVARAVPALLASLALACPRSGPSVLEPTPGPAPVEDAATAPVEEEATAEASDAEATAAAVPPEAVTTQVPEIPLGPCPAEQPYQCTVPLTAPAAGRRVALRTEGVELRFGFDEFRAQAAERNEREVLEFLDGRPTDEETVRLDAEPGPQTNRWPFVVAALLDQGKARVHDEAGNRDAESIVRETWDWVGCAGSCRQSGRRYRLQVPGEVFYSVTDLFEDSF
jgi:hypothetical protein